MPPPLLFDLGQLDLDRIIITKEAIYKILPHRHEFALLDGIVYFDAETGRFVGRKDVRSDEWSAR